MTIADRVADRILAAAKQPTFPQAQEAILAQLKKSGWAVTTGLKVPYATSPDGTFRLWFKAQAVYFTVAPDRRHQFGAARTVSYDLDIRKMSPEEFEKNAERWQAHYSKP